MERGWGRADEPLRLSLGEINRLIAPHHASSSELIQEGHANTNYLLSLTGGRKAILRLYQRDRSSQALEGAIARLFQGLPWSPAVILNGDGFVLVEWKPGRTMESLLADGSGGDVLSAAEELGSALAKISAVTFPVAGFLAADHDRLHVREAWPSAIDGYYGYLDMCLARPRLAARASSEFVGRIRHAMDRARPALEQAAGPPCLAHGDFKASNLLIDDGRLSAVLDWEFAHAGTWILSTAQILRHDQVLPAGFAAAFAQGFGAGKLPQGWQSLSATMDVVNMVDFLGREAATPALIEDSTRIIEKGIATWG